MRGTSEVRLAALALAAMFMSSAASAGVPIPCTGERLIKVSEEGMKRPDGVIVYLGYKYSGCSDGAWVGYLSTRQYLTLRDGDAAAAKLAVAVGLRTLPEPPSRLAHPGTFWVEWLWGVLASLGVVGTALNGLARQDENNHRSGARTA
jgi:hypothetical protein